MIYYRVLKNRWIIMSYLQAIFRLKIFEWKVNRVDSDCEANTRSLIHHEAVFQSLGLSFVVLQGVLLSVGQRYEIEEGLSAVALLVADAVICG